MNSSQQINKPPTPRRSGQEASSRVGYPSKELLEDLCSRFLLNVPAEELQSFDRLLFLVEQAHWFYEDNTRETYPDLKSFSLREFTLLMFQSCATLQPYIPHVDNIYKDFTLYKGQVPTTGAIILNKTHDKILLVKGWKSGSSWGFPKGKKNKDEEDSHCAAREVWEEVGVDISNLIRPEDFLELVIGQQRCRLYVILGVPETSKFEPRTKKEISEIAWHPIDSIPGAGQSDSTGPPRARFYLVNLYIRPLKEWLVSRRLMHLNAPTGGPLDITLVYKSKVSANESAQASPAQSPSVTRTSSGEFVSKYPFSPVAVGSESENPNRERGSNRPKLPQANKNPTRRSLLPLLVEGHEAGKLRTEIPLLTPLSEGSPAIRFVSSGTGEDAPGNCLRNFKLDARKILDCLKL